MKTTSSASIMIKNCINIFVTTYGMIKIVMQDVSEYFAKQSECKDLSRKVASNQKSKELKTVYSFLFPINC